MASFNFGSLISTLQAAGLTGTNLTTAVQTLAQNSPSVAIKGYCTTILQNSGNPSVVKDLATKIAEVPNLPIAVNNLLPQLVGAASPHDVVVAVQDIETALGGTSNFLGF